MNKVTNRTKAAFIVSVIVMLLSFWSTIIFAKNAVVTVINVALYTASIITILWCTTEDKKKYFFKNILIFLVMEIVLFIPYILCA